MLILVACHTKQTPQEMKAQKSYTEMLPCGERLEGFKCDGYGDTGVHCDFITTSMEENYTPKIHTAYGFNNLDGNTKIVYKESRCK